MNREEYGTGKRFSRLSIILMSIVGLIWSFALVVTAYLLPAWSYYEYGNELENFIEEFYNSSDSEQACIGAPILYDSYGKVSENSVIQHNACLEAHQAFKTMFPDVSAVYVITFSANYENGEYTSESYKVVALKENGEIVEELSKITIPFITHSYPYYFDYKTIEHHYDDGYIIRQFPNYSEITYGIDDGSDTWWEF